MARLVQASVPGTAVQARVWEHAMPARRRLATLAGQTSSPWVWLAAATYGVPYKWGGIDLRGFDCSALVQWAWVVMERGGLLTSNLHPTMPRRASLQAVRGAGRGPHLLHPPERRGAPRDDQPFGLGAVVAAARSELRRREHARR